MAEIGHGEEPECGMVDPYHGIYLSSRGASSESTARMSCLLLRHSIISCCWALITIFSSNPSSCERST